MCYALIVTTQVKLICDPINLFINRESLIQTTGATNGLYMLASLMFGPGDLVFTERISYFLAIKVLKDGLRYNVNAG